MSNSLFNSALTPAAANPNLPAPSLCPGNVPLVLLPVRLETRFFTLPNGATELRVRIYPDKIHVDTHEVDLTTDERTSGTQYWQQDWTARTDSVARANAWRVLAGRFGAARAAWIARVLQPTNLALRSTAPAPEFPTLPPVGVGGESAWRHAPQARLLPDRWTAIIHSGGQAALSVTGKDITRPLAVGPDPQAPPPDAATEAAILAGDKLALDPGMTWMVDFTAAESVGMALRIAISPAILTAGIDSLVVFGVATSLGVANTATQLADLLDAHHYTDGLEFLRFGTPSNNTDDRRAGYSTDDADHARSFANEVVADPNNAPNALRVGTALGLPFGRIAPTLGRIAQAGQDHDLDFRSMNTALWQVGWGYFLTNMMGAETGLTTESIDWARGHFINYVRAGGSMPAIRCGTQPYGILPTTSLDQWAPGAGESVDARETWLRSFLSNMRDRVWRPVVGNVPRIGLRQTPPDPDADLADIMRTDGVSNGNIARGVLGRHYVQHLSLLLGQDANAAVSNQDVTAARMLQLLGLPTGAAQRPRLAHGFFSSFASAVTAPLVQAGEISPWQLLQPNYIAALLAAPTIQALIDMRPSPTGADNTTSLFQMLLRHALLRELANATARIATTGNNLPTLLRDLELIDLVDSPVTNRTVFTPPASFHWRRQLDSTVPSITGTITIRRFLEGLTTFNLPAVTSLGEFRASLARLQGMDTERLQFLTQSTLDLSAHRLDAWITSFATKRLAMMSLDGPMGQYVGGYGWVENLRPAAPSVSVSPGLVPPGEQVPLFAPAKDSGFIHAPSLTHASTAALLRNAHLGPTGIPQANGPFAIDLSSRRVREASRLLDGVRSGQPLGALLGYRFERRLHDLNLDQFIAPLRNVAPLIVRQRETNTAPAETLAANNVVDALVLMRRWQDPADSGVSTALSTATTSQATQITTELVALRDSVDGLSDALTAEVAYQMARGNPSRMASTLSAIARGEGLPPELEVAKMPRTGIPITHRVVALMSGPPVVPAGWTGSGSSVLANNERMLNAWASRLLPDARKIRCTIERLDGTGAVAETVAFPLSEVPLLTQLDFIYGLEPVGGSTHQQSLSTVEQLVLYQSRRRTGGFAADANLRLQHALPTNLVAGETTLFDVMDQGRAIRRLLEGARGLRPDDLCPPERASQATIDLVDLEARVVRTENGLNAAHKALVAKVAKGQVTLAEDYRVGMMLYVPYGIGPAVPCVATGDTPDIRTALMRQAIALIKLSGLRLDQGAALRAQPAAADPRARCDQLIERARAVFGAKFVMLPSFTLDATSATELKNALAASTQQQGGDPLAVHGWFTRSARVRDAVTRFAACLRGSEVLAASDRLALAVAQLPFDSTERWVGLPPLPGTELPPSKLSLEVQSSLVLNTTLALTGVFVDEWVEVVPSKSETTALTFQFDPPNSFAPQNVLVAVPPVPGQDWTTETLRRVLVETLDLAKLRAVDTSRLGAAAQYLPALYVPFNAADDAVSTDFAPLTR